MSRKSATLLAGAALATLASFASAQVTVNGVVGGGEYAAPLTLQTTKTGFGNNFNELNGAYGAYDLTSGVLNLAFTGNLEGTGFPNRFVLFLDTKSGGVVANAAGGGFNQFGSVGGQATDDWGTDTDGGAGVSPTPGGGSIVPAGFNPELSFEVNYYAPNDRYYTNIIDMTLPNEDHPNRDVYLGENQPGAGGATQTYYRDGGVTPAGSVTHAFNNSNVDGVVGNGDPDQPGAYPQGDPTTSLTGFEYGFDSAFVSHEPGKAIRAFAFISNPGGDYLSNQFLPGIGYTNAGNLEGAGGFGGGPLFDARDLPTGDGFMLTIWEPTFTAGANNKWSTAANWAGAFAPNGVEHDAAFNGAGGAVDLDTNVTVGTLKFNGTGGYTVGTTSASAITLNAGSGAARIESAANQNVVSAKVVLASDARLITRGAAQLTLGDLENLSGKTITTAGTGNVILGAQNHSAGSIMVVDSGNATFSQDAGTPAARNLRVFANGNLQLNSTQNLQELGVNAGGSATMAANGNRTLYADNLSVAFDVGNSVYTGKLDMTDNDLVVNNGSYSTLWAAVLGGFGNTVGITSSSSDGSQILALFDNAQVGATDWNGAPVGANAVIGKYTYFGDANIDGQVTGDDYTVIDANLNSTPAVGLGWLSGDMNLDGTITGDDYTVIDANLNLGVGNPLGASSLSAVPEPASLGVLATAAAGLLMRRRRNG